MILLINLSYLLTAIFFVFGLKMMSSPKTARPGNLLSSLGMLIAVIVTLLSKEIISYTWVMVGLLIGSFIGIIIAKKTKMTSLTQMVALSHGLGGLASLLVGWVAYILTPHLSPFIALTVFLAILIGGITFTGSLIAFAKLSEIFSGKPIVFIFQRFFNFLCLASSIVFGLFFTVNANAHPLMFYGIIILSLILGVLLIIPIGGADMPVVISLLNSYSGLAAAATGFVVSNNVLIVSGALVGASGMILTMIMCKAMNRSLGNVLFSGFGKIAQSKKEVEKENIKSCSPKDAYFVLEAAKNVVIVPGYGLAVAQAQHLVKELLTRLEDHGIEVKFAIHPVAGRMPGHMNVLLAEADIPYDQLFEMDRINDQMGQMDVALVIGANDTVNPAAEEDPTSPIYGMPIIKAYLAKNVFVLKRSMASGFAGIPNPLFSKENTTMIFGDAKETLQALINEF